MNKLFLVASLVSALALTQGCAANSQEDAADPQTSAAAAVTATPVQDDAVVQAKIKELIAGASFTSESDYGYTVLLGDDGPKLKTISSKTVRTRLGAAIMAANSDHRDIRQPGSRAVSLSVPQAITGADADANDANSEEDPYRIHGRKLAATLRYMQANLKGMKAYTFGTNADGDQDEIGTVVYVYVGISRKTGKLIAIMTEAVYT